MVLERNTRNKKKCVTTISGLDVFGVKLAEASKLFGKKFASGASIVKNAEGKEQIDIQVGGRPCEERRGGRWGWAGGLGQPDRMHCLGVTAPTRIGSRVCLRAHSPNPPNRFPRMPAG